MTRGRTPPHSNRQTTYSTDTFVVLRMGYKEPNTAAHTETTRYLLPSYAPVRGHPPISRKALARPGRLTAVRPIIRPRRPETRELSPDPSDSRLPNA